MSEINFLPENDNKKTDKNKQKEAAPKIAYSKPGAVKNEDRLNFKPAEAKTGPTLAKTNGNLREKRKAVLTSIKKDKNNAGEIISSKPSFFSNFRSALGAIFRKRKKEKKKDKEILAESKEIFDAEKSARKNNLEPKKNIPGDTLEKGNSGNKNKWQAIKVLKTNLIQDEVTVFVDWSKHLKSLFTYLLLVFFLIALSYGGLIFWEMKASREKQAQSIAIEDLKQKIINKMNKVKEIEDFEKELALAGFLLNKHIYWTNFFDFLEKNTLSNVYYNGGFSGNTSGQYNFAATTDSFESISDQVSVMRASEEVIDVSVEKGDFKMGKEKEGVPAKSEVDFKMDLSLDPKLFVK